MINLAKSYEFFKPEDCQERIHIIGCGAIGSTLAENLARLGLTKITLYDFDYVESHNIANQMFTQEDVGKFKVDAVAEMMCRINPDIANDLKVVREGYTSQRLSGYVFLAVDSIDLRRTIATANVSNMFIKAMFDFRMRLVDAQHYAAEWNNNQMVKDFLGQMDFTSAEAAASTPVSACNMTLSVAPTVRSIVAFGVSNFMNYVKTGEIKKMILVDAFGFTIDAF